jgi:hypothetical protein
MPKQAPELTLVPLEPTHQDGWRVGRNATRRNIFAAAAEQNLLNEQDRADRLVEYIAALSATTECEWRYEMASGQAYVDGALHFVRLWGMQAELDPSGAIWRSVAPEGFCVAQPRIVRAAS